MNVVACQPMPHAVLARVGRGQAVGLPAPTPAMLRAYLQRTELVERNRRAVGGSLVYVAPDYFFLEQSLGSLHSFHVLVRRSLTLPALRI